MVRKNEKIALKSCRITAQFGDSFRRIGVDVLNESAAKLLERHPVKRCRTLIGINYGAVFPVDEQHDRGMLIEIAADQPNIVDLPTGDERGQQDDSQQSQQTAGDKSGSDAPDAHALISCSGNREVFAAWIERTQPRPAFLAE